MGFLVLLLIVAVIWLVSKASSLSTRLANLEAQLAKLGGQIETLSARLVRLQRGHGPAAPTVEPAPVAALTGPAPVADPLPVVAPTTQPPVALPIPVILPPGPAPAAPVASTPVVVTPSAFREPTTPSVFATSPPAVPRPQPSAAMEPEEKRVAAAAPAAQAESWEMVVGTSWLNKIGVLVFIIGVALLVGYSFAHIGPAGRVAIGYALSFGMLGGGVFLERRQAFRNYAYGLVAGGWAGVYFTTFAMHDVPAAKVIESDLAAVTLLTTVAAGMIAHSLRYRSQVVTSLAFVVAYTTLALSPLSGFSLVASVPLSLALLLVSQRLGWPGISALGIAATYGAFVLRGVVFPGGVMDPYAALPYVTLACYWLTFEAADIIGLRLRHRAADRLTGSAVSMLALNAIGFMGALLMIVPGSNPHLFSIVLFSAASAYAASAVLRAWLLPGWRARHATDEPFDSAHGATAIAATLFACAIGLRFSGNHESLARLLEAELLITAGLVLGDVWLRRLGSIGMALAAGHAWLLIVVFGTGAQTFSWAPGTTSALLCLMAVACYGHREALHRRTARPVWFEPAFTWTATGLLATVVLLELEPAHQALAGLVLAALLLAIGFRRSAEYIHQSYALGPFASYGMLAAFLVPPNATGALVQWGAAPSALDEWTVLPAGVLLMAAAAWRLSTRTSDAAIPGRLIAAGVSGTLATAFLVVFEWRVLSPNAIAPGWALTATGLVALGAWRHQSILRWQGYVVALGATVRAVGPLLPPLGRPPQSTPETAAIALVIAAVYAAAYLGRRAIFGAHTPTAGATAVPAADERVDRGLQVRDSTEAAATALLSFVATASFLLFKWRVLPELLVAPAWAATGLVLVALGVYRSRSSQRLQGYAVAAIGAFRVTASLLEQPTASVDAALWASVVIALVYATAWVARRFVVRTPDAVAAIEMLPIFGTVTLAVLQSRIFDDLTLGPAWTATAVTLLVLGLWRRAADLRWQGYALLALGALRTGRPVFTVDAATTAALLWLGTVIGALYICGLVVRRAAHAAEVGGRPQPAEDTVGAVMLLGATALLGALILQEVQSSLVTLALGLQGLALMFSGLIARERVMRLSGLALLLACILRLFVYDLGQLEPLARIMSFVILGLFLLAISWTYTRYGEQIRKFL